MELEPVKNVKISTYNCLGNIAKSVFAFSIVRHHTVQGFFAEKTTFGDIEYTDQKWDIWMITVSVFCSIPLKGIVSVKIT